jgi:hypothetical protein
LKLAVRRKVSKECHVQILVLDVQEEISVSTYPSEVLKPKVSVPENKGSVGTPKVAETTETEMEIKQNE